MKKIIVVAAPLALAACGGPIELTVAKLAGDFISYVSTGKSTTDHAVSMVAERDCALHRPLFEEDICRDDVLVAAEPPATLATYGEPEIKRELRAADPAIYAVNAPQTSWANPSGAASSSAVARIDLPPRTPVNTPETVNADQADITQVASAEEKFTDQPNDEYRAPEGPLDLQAQADAAIAGYVTEDDTAKGVNTAQTQTAALVDPVVMSDEVPSAQDDDVSGNDAPALAGDDLALPLPGDYVILASFVEKGRAENALTIYGEYQPRLLTATVGGRDYLRVAVGPLSSEHANDLRLLAAKKGIKDPWIVAIAPSGE
ncbi:SPOR domain-containing protein [Thalassospira sp. MA62]|nr:SPOR domain-containing protein [Thalassospira sp. MA62]